jgi:hypothetical protein
MLPEDCETFLGFVQRRDPVILTEFTSDSLKDLRPLERADCYGKWLCLWNQRLLPTLERNYIDWADTPYYRIKDSSPTLQLNVPIPSDWAGRPALTQGRLYAHSYQENAELRRWYEALVRWLRSHFIKNPIPWMSGYVGPKALAWHQRGGLLLPFVRPPITPEWEDRILTQLATR